MEMVEKKKKKKKGVTIHRPADKRSTETCDNQLERICIATGQFQSTLDTIPTLSYWNNIETGVDGHDWWMRADGSSIAFGIQSHSWVVAREKRHVSPVSKLRSGRLKGHFHAISSHSSLLVQLSSDLHPAAFKTLPISIGCYWNFRSGSCRWIQAHHWTD